MNLFKNKTFINLVCSVINSALILAVFAKISANEEFMNVFFNSDTLYLPSIYIDIFREGGSLSGWELNPAPNFFPDMPVYFILMAIFKNFVLVSALFSILQYIFIVWLFTKLFKLLFPNHSNSYFLVIHIFFSFFLLESLFFTESFFYTFVILSNAYHMGSFVLALCCFYLTLSYIKQSKNYHILLLFILQFLAVLSDKLFIILFIAPLLASITMLAKAISIKKTIILFTTSILALVCGVFTFIYLNESDYLNICTTPLVRNIKDITTSYNTFIELMLYYSRYFGFKVFIFYFFILSFGLNIYLYFKNFSQPFSLLKFYLNFVLFFTIFVLSAPILSGNFLTGDQIRYNIFPFCLFPLNVSVFLASQTKLSKLKYYGKHIVTSLIIMLAIASFSKLNLKGLHSFINYYPETTKQIDSIAEKNNLHYGIAGYWDAKKITLFSKKSLVIRPVDDAIALYWHVANINWFYSPQVFDFIVLNSIRDTTFYSWRLKPQKFISYNKNLKLLKVSPFMFNKENGILPVNLGY